MAVRKSGLGRGLDALIPAEAAQGYTTIPLDAISPNPQQPRQAMSPERHGMASPKMTHACEYETSVMLAIRPDLVHLDRGFVVDVLDDLVTDYRLWEEERKVQKGLFWQYDVRDGMEESISGSQARKHARPTINSYMFANAQAIAQIARLAARPKLAREFDTKAAELKRLTQEQLWDDEAGFFKVRLEGGSCCAAIS